MGGGGPTGSARGLHQHQELLLGEGRQRLAIGSPAVVGVHLDPVGAVAHLAPHHPGDVFRAGRLLGSLERLEGVVAAARPVAPRSHDGAGDGQEAGTRHHAALDRMFELHVVVERTLGAEVTHGGHSGAERGRGVRDRLRRPEPDRLLQHLVVPERLVVGMEEEVRVSLVGRTDRLDALTPHDDQPAGVR